jgi:hypothetical protein
MVRDATFNGRTEGDEYLLEDFDERYSKCFQQR